MGYGEFGGGGSVKWEVKHTDGESGDGDKHGGKGKDKHPGNDTGIFTVMVEDNDQLIFQTTVPVKNGKVRVIWGDPTVSPGGIRSLAAAGGRRLTASKKTSPKR